MLCAFQITAMSTFSFNSSMSFFFFNYYYFLNLFWLRRVFVAVRGLLIAVASLVVERRLSSCGARAQLLRGMWDLPGSGIEAVSPALAGGFSTTVPPGKPPQGLFTYLLNFDCTILGDGDTEMNKTSQFLEFLHLMF